MVKSAQDGAGDNCATALGYAGKKGDTQKQFALAAGLDLSNEDKAELAMQPH